MAKKRKLSKGTSPKQEPEPEVEDQKTQTETGEPSTTSEPAEANVTEPVNSTEIPPIKVEQPEPVESNQPQTEKEPERDLQLEPVTEGSGEKTKANVGEEEEENDADSIKNLLEPLQKEQLVVLLRDAAMAHRDVLQRIVSMADIDPAHRKIFVHGLGWDTTTETLRAAFTEYGDIEECKAVVDKVTGRSKGYGFILFKHRSSARQALQEPNKKIGNRMTACQLASAGPPSSAQTSTPPASVYTQRKIFVSNVGPDIDPQKLTQFFAKFGEIEEGPLGLDKATGKPKGFCLYVYKTMEGAKKALEEPHKSFEGHVLICSKANDGPKPNKASGAFQLQNTGFGGANIQRNSSASGIPSGVTSHLGGPSGGHLMAPAASGLGLNQPIATGLNPALGQALTALIATQGTSFGLTNVLGQLGTVGNPAIQSPMVNTGALGLQGVYGNQTIAGGTNLNPAGTQTQGGYGRGRQGQYGGVPPYMGR